MAQNNAAKPPIQPSKKRKEPPTSAKPSNNPSKKPKTSHHNTRQRDARTLSTQTSSKAFSNGALDVDKFVQAREFEIRALEQGMRRSKKALNQRAFQQVPRELRRRTASQDVQRVPQRLRGQAKKEMVEDNTPARRKKPTRHMRLRLETAKKLRALGAQRKAAKEKEKEEKVSVTDPNIPTDQAAEPAPTKPATTVVQTRKPKIKKKATLAKPPVPRAKFRKRQTHKSWLPTHLFHAKRAHMTPPSAPLWRFAIPLTPTQKGYRPTHRASHERGAVAWDVSYFSTIGLEGEERSLESVLKAMGVGEGVKGEKWRSGKRVLETFLFEREEPKRLIAPVTVIWCVPSPVSGTKEVGEGKRKRKLFLRVHPSAFYQVWEEVVRLAKVAKPGVKVEDLRFEIGSIEIIGPGSTEALLGALWPSKPSEDHAEQAEDSVEKLWTSLAGVTNPAVLPSGALLGFDIQDPRLHHPPRTITLPKTQDEQDKLLELLSTWPIDKTQPSPHLFDRKARLQGSKLSSQKAINRRRTLSTPGTYPSPLPTDPQIPILLYTHPSTLNKKQQPVSWTLLAPWKTIQPIWYAIMYYPLSTGQQPRFGGLREQQQLAFEAGRPWFPADFPGTQAGWGWEVQERRKRWEEWQRRPKGKRVCFEKVDLGVGRKGEVGEGWGCDWAVLLGDQAGTRETLMDAVAEATGEMVQKDTAADKKEDKKSAPPKPPPKPDQLSQLPIAQAVDLLNPTSNSSPPDMADLDGKLVTVRLTLLSRGVPQTCARIYRLPSASTNPELRKAWLALLPTNQSNKHRGPKDSLPKLPKNAPAHLVQQRLAQSLLETPRAGEEKYPACPGLEDLVGFVTSGNFNLAEGQGTGVGNLVLQKVLEEARQDGGEGRLCVVRNAGNDVGRLAKWEVV